MIYIWLQVFPMINSSLESERVSYYYTSIPHISSKISIFIMWMRRENQKIILRDKIKIDDKSVTFIPFILYNSYFMPRPELYFIKTKERKYGVQCSRIVFILYLQLSILLSGWRYRGNCSFLCREQKIRSFSWERWTEFLCTIMQNLI